MVQALEAEQKRLQGATHPLLRALLERTIAGVHKELVAQIEAAVAALVAFDKGLVRKAALLQTVLGVGWTVASGV